MNQKTARILIKVFFLLMVFIFVSDSMAQMYRKSYALVIGINKYPSRHWKDLTYARKDAEGITEFLRSQGFEVITLYDNEATKAAIISKMQSDLARQVKKNDRILVFFAGHGHTDRLADQDWGYIVPYDAGSSSATYISMEELQTLSEKMGKAKHQLFIMDACYGGLLGLRVGGVDPIIPDYLKEVTKRIARQIITAGGKDQQVVDSGPKGHSVFTGHLLEALREALADTNGDGYITFAELTSYLVPRASNAYQTPAPGTLPGHGLGEFVFKSPAGAIRSFPKIIKPATAIRRGRMGIKDKLSDVELSDFSSFAGINYNDSYNSIVTKLGKPLEEKDVFETKVLHYFYNYFDNISQGGLRIDIGEKNKVSAISVRYRGTVEKLISKGIHDQKLNFIGMNLNDIRALLGDVRISKDGVWRRIGYSFDFAPGINGRITFTAEYYKDLVCNSITVVYWKSLIKDEGKTSEN